MLDITYNNKQLDLVGLGDVMSRLLIPGGAFADSVLITNDWSSEAEHFYAHCKKFSSSALLEVKIISLDLITRLTSTDTIYYGYC